MEFFVADERAKEIVSHSVVKILSKLENESV
jgi:hypothetical protein